MTHKYPPGARFHRGLPYTGDTPPDDLTWWTPLLAERFFAANLRHEREARGMTQAALARLLTLRDVPLSQTAIAKLERENDETRRPLRLFEAAAISDVFDRSVHDMCFSVPPQSDAHREYLEAERRLQSALAAQIAAEQELEEAKAAADQVAAEVQAAHERLADDVQHREEA